jgi:hypothetical protein
VSVAREAREQSEQVELLARMRQLFGQVDVGGREIYDGCAHASGAARSFRVPGISPHTLRCARSICATFRHYSCRSGFLRSGAAKAGYDRTWRPSSTHLRRAAELRLLHRQ